MTEQKTDWLLYAILLLAVVVIAIAFVTIKTIKAESGKCIMNPIQYGVDHYAEQRNENIQCSCTSLETFEIPFTYTSDWTKK